MTHPSFRLMESIHGDPKVVGESGPLKLMAGSSGVPGAAREGDVLLQADLIVQLAQPACTERSSPGAE